MPALVKHRESGLALDKALLFQARSVIRNFDREIDKHAQ